MIPRKLFLIIFLIALNSTGNAQDEINPRNHHLHFSDFSVQYGIFPLEQRNATLDDFRKLSKGSELLNNDFSSYYHFNNVGFSYGSRRPVLNMLSLYANLQVRGNNEPVENQENFLRLGCTYYSGELFKNAMYSFRSVTFDTLISQTGYPVYYDSIFRRDYYLQYSIQQILLDVSVVKRLKGQGLLSVFFGAGIKSGITLNAITDIYYWENNSVQARSGTESLWNENIQKTETIENKTGFSAFLFVPMGIEFRLGRKHEFWKRFQMFYEAGAGVNIITVPELRTYKGVGTKHGLGLRVSLD